MPKASPDFISYARPCVAQLREYDPGVAAVAPVEESLPLLKASANENSGAPSPAVVRAIESALSNIHRYPESRGTVLLERLGQRYGLSADWFLLGNGLDGVLTLLGLTFLNPGDEVVCAELTFSVYAGTARTMDAIPIRIPMDAGWGNDLDGFLQRITDRTKMIFLCNPNNPTGTLTRAGDLERFLDAIPERVLVVLDEAYADFADDAAFTSGFASLAGRPNLIVLKTFSKILGLAGLRVGFAAAHPGLLELMYRVREPYNVNCLALAAATAALEDDAFWERSRALVIRERERFCRFLASRGIEYTPSQANFVFIRLKGSRGAFEVCRDLAAHGILLRPLEGEGVANGIRVTLGSATENNRIMEALSALV